MMAPSDRSEAGGQEAAGYSVHPDQRFRHEFYEAFRAWFMQSGCDFWSECDAPEALAVIAVEIARQSLVDDSQASAPDNPDAIPVYRGEVTNESR